MSSLTQQYIDAATKSQEVALDAVKSWNEQVQKAWEASRQNVSGLVTGQPLPGPVEVVDATFEGLETLLNVQRDCYHAVAEAFAPIVEQALTSAQSVAETLTPKS